MELSSSWEAASCSATKESPNILWNTKVHATADTSEYATNVLNEVLEERLICCRLWSARSPDLNPSDFYLYWRLKAKCIQIILTHWMNLSISIVKLFHLSRSVNSNSSFQQTSYLFNTKRETLQASTVMMSSCKLFIFFKNSMSVIIMHGILVRI
jgi:hypothetical protein